MSEKLMRENIQKAQKEIESKKEIVKAGQMRQHYHFMPQTGWINDPNGLIYYKGKYHYFYQLNPYYGHWDYMHWGHAISSDLMHWEYLPVALAPSEEYDDHMRGGCFSGSAIEHDGKLFLMYTVTSNHGEGYVQTQCIAYSEDGINFTKYGGNPVICPPEGVPSDLFRDQKVWEHDGVYYMVCGASRNKRGQALLYRSSDMLHWEFFNVLAESRGEWGYMWECPDFYQLEDKYVLTFSPMGESDRKAVYLVGDFDYENIELKAGDGISFEMKMKADLEQTDADRLEIDLRCGGEKKTICIFDFKHGIMKIDRNHSDGWSKGISYSTLFLKGKKELDIHIFSDQSSLEIFADNYQNNHANNVFAGDNQNQILIRAYGGDVLIRDYESYGMKECFR